MVLLSSELASSLHRWELAEYISEGFVIAGCAGELVALIRRIPKRCREQIETWSTVVLVLALTIGLKCLIRTNELSGMVIGSLGEKAEEADNKAKTAIVDSSTALSQAKDALNKAGAAQSSLGKAESEARGAQTAASNALTLASGARKEADTFERDIKLAKDQAASAESHLAEALQKATDATRRLSEEESKRAAIEKRLAWRSLTAEQVNALAERLKLLTPQRVDVMTYPHDSEAEQLANLFLAAFIKANWKWNRFEPMDSEGITNIFVEFDPSDKKSGESAKALFDGIKGCDLAVFGPASTLPREYRVGYMGGPLNVKPDAPVRLTIGSNR